MGSASLDSLKVGSVSSFKEGLTVPPPSRGDSNENRLILLSIFVSYTPTELMETSKRKLLLMI